MKLRPKKPKLALRQWTKASLTPDDYAVAKAAKHGDWQTCLAARLWQHSRAGKGAVAWLLDWESLREFAGNSSPPFLAAAAHRQTLEAILARPPGDSNRPVKPLGQVPLTTALRAEQACRRFDRGIIVRAFAIPLDDDPDYTVARFRAWLQASRAKADSRSWVPEMRQHFNRRGRLSWDAHLRALAVFRLKRAGYKREEAEAALNLKRYDLSGEGGHWAKLPKLAGRIIAKTTAMIEELATKPATAPAPKARALSKKEKKKAEQEARKRVLCALDQVDAAEFARLNGMTIEQAKAVWQEG